MLWKPLAAITVFMLPIAAWTPRTAAPKRISIQMVDVSPTAYKFEPSAITASAGDTLHFSMGGAMPHNVEFRTAPAGASLGAARTGPYLTKAGDSYDIVLDGRFPAGEYQFVCVPHEPLGMKATLTVQP